MSYSKRKKTFQFYWFFSKSAYLILTVMFHLIRSSVKKFGCCNEEPHYRIFQLKVFPSSLVLAYLVICNRLSFYNMYDGPAILIFLPHRTYFGILLLLQISSSSSNLLLIDHIWFIGDSWAPLYLQYHEKAWMFSWKTMS